MTLFRVSHRLTPPPQDMKSLVRFFLSFLYAGEDLLGWDPTMRIVRDAKTREIQYVVAVQAPTDADPQTPRTEYYRTGRVISNFATTYLRGRGTRVWEVTRCTKIGGPYRGQTQKMILKDCWVDTDRDQEGAILGRVLEDAKAMGKWAEMKAFLLTVKIHGDVRVDGGRRDETPKRDPLGVPPKDQWFDLIQVSEDAAQRAEAGRQSQQSDLHGTYQSVYDYVQPPRSPVLYHSKVHYRIVFQEVCTVLRDIDQLDHVLTVLSGACEGVSSPFLRLTLFLIFDSIEGPARDRLAPSRRKHWEYLDQTRWVCCAGRPRVCQKV